MAAFTAATACWIVLCLVTSGDFFARGSSLAFLAIVVTGLGGFYFGFRSRSRSLRVVLAVATLACVVFWIAAPNGWWAMPPPTPAEVQVR
jgi:hypothetical protein